MTSSQTDRAFTRAVGIVQNCDMCDLLTVEARRYENRLRRLDQMLRDRTCELRRRSDVIRMWKLATFAASLAAIMLGWAATHHA